MRYLLIIALSTIMLEAQLRDIPLFSDNYIVTPNQRVRVYTKPDSNFRYAVEQLFTIKWGEINISPQELTLESFYFNVPSNLNRGIFKLTVDVDDGPYAEVEFKLITSNDYDLDSLVDGGDPDPETQNGVTHNLGEDPTPLDDKDSIFNKSGGDNNNTIPCDSTHIIDGIFSQIKEYSYREWSGITPQRGKFSRLYIDICDSTMYLLNDWILADSLPHSTCYNLFEFYTGNGKQHWRIKIFQDINKPMEVYLNGEDISENDSIVVGGSAGFDSSPNMESPHTIYEFAVKVLPGNFFIPSLGDPVRPLFPRTICDDNGYGIVKDPILFTGNFSEDGTTLNRNKRYIPLGTIPGLVKEPDPVFGNIDDGICYKFPENENEICIDCSTSDNVIDGKFSENEYGEPAIGRYSNFYANYCDSIIFVLNDWKLATTEPDSKTCYNLFELYSGNSQEHWGIYVYQDLDKGIKVFRNGEDVSSDSDFVVSGSYSFDSIGEEDEPNPIYEFGIKPLPGNFVLMLADPGPSSFCDDDFETRPAPRSIDQERFSVSSDNFIYENGVTQNKVEAFYGDTVNITYSFNNLFSDLLIKNVIMEINYDKYHFYPFTEALESSLGCDDCLELVQNTDERIASLNIDLRNVDNQLLSQTSTIELKGILLASDNKISELSHNLYFTNTNTNLYQTDEFNLQLESKSRTTIGNLLVNRLEVGIRAQTKNSMLLDINSSSQEEISLELYDNLGYKLLDQKQYPNKSGELVSSVNISNLSNGVYFILVKQNSDVVSLKFVRL